MMNIQQRDLYMHDCVKCSFNIGLHLDVCEPVSFKLGMMLDTI